MKKPSCFRGLTLLAGGLLVLQIGGCSLNEINDIVQTALLGVTAAGAVAILQNI